MTSVAILRARESLLDRAREVASAIEADPADPALADRVQRLERLLDEASPQESQPPDREALASPACIAECHLRVGDLWYAVRRYPEALRRLRLAVTKYRALEDNDANLDAGIAAPNTVIYADGHASLARALVRTGHHAEGLALATQAERRVAQALAAGAPVQPALHAKVHHILGYALGLSGQPAEACVATRRAIEIRAQLVAAGDGSARGELARAHANLALWLSDLGRHEDALAQAEQAVEQYQALERENPRAAEIDLARELSNLATMRSGLGHHQAALDAARASLVRRRRLHERNPAAFSAELAVTLHNVGAMLSELGRPGEALLPTQETVSLRRHLAAQDRKAHLYDLASSLLNEGSILNALSLPERSVRCTAEAIGLLRELLAGSPPGIRVPLGMASHNLSRALRSVDRLDEAERAACEAVATYRSQAEQAPEAFQLQLATALNQLGVTRRQLGRRVDADEAVREAGQVLLTMGPDDPFLWCEQALQSARQLTAAADLAAFQVQLMHALVERRELARDAEHAALYLATLRTLALEAWGAMATLPAEDHEVHAVLGYAIVAELQSPDLTPWLLSGAEIGSESLSLRQARRAVLEGDHRFLELLSRLRAGEDIQAELAQARADADDRRTTYRSLRARLLSAPLSARATGAAAVTALRHELAALARPAQATSERSDPSASALVCLLVLGEGEQRRAVGWLMDAAQAAQRAVQLLAFPGLLELARGLAACPCPERGRQGRHLRRGQSMPSSASGASGPEQPCLDLDRAASLLRQELLTPILAALGLEGPIAGSPTTSTLHVCLHSELQQLPLGLLDAEFDRCGISAVVWPGLAYLSAAATRAAKPASSTWLVGHDCAWDGDAPLPMAAVEARLLKLLLGDDRVQPATTQALAAGGIEGIVLCGHGESAAAHAGTVPLGHFSIPLEHIAEAQSAPRIAVLPMCHAGLTTDDAAGNAVGVATGLLLGGATLVVASSRAVDDYLIPWFTTLLVWHLAQGYSREGRIGAYTAAHLARRQIASGAVPKAYRHWLIEAFPAAAAVVLPGGEEWPAFERTCARARGHSPGTAPDALAPLPAPFQGWPWLLPAVGLLAPACSQARAAAVRAMAQHILDPDSACAPEALSVQARLREMAAFVFIYGMDTAAP